jgi:hypothetical protein
MKLIECDHCGGSGFSGPGTGYGDVCSECGGSKMIAMSLTDANNLDAVVRELGIEDSDITPIEAVRELKAELAAAQNSASFNWAERVREVESVRKCHRHRRKGRVMTNETMLGYYIFDGRKWLGNDNTWSDDFYNAVSFDNVELAKAIGEKEEEGDRTIYILGCLPS